MSKVILLLCLIISINVKANISEPSNIDVVINVKKIIVSYAVKKSSIQKACSKIKSISLSAINFVQTDGEQSSDELNELATIISQELQHDAVYLKKDKVIETIISAINS